MISAASPAQSAGAWLSELQALNLSLRDHEHVPLYDIQAWAGQQGAALFDTLLVFENFPVAEALKQGAPAGLTCGRPMQIRTASTGVFLCCSGYSLPPQFHRPAPG